MPSVDRIARFSLGLPTPVKTPEEMFTNPIIIYTCLEKAIADICTHIASEGGKKLGKAHSVVTVFDTESIATISDEVFGTSFRPDESDVHSSASDILSSSSHNLV